MTYAHLSSYEYIVGLVETTKPSVSIDQSQHGVER